MFSEEGVRAAIRETKKETAWLSFDGELYVYRCMGINQNHVNNSIHAAGIVHVPCTSTSVDHT